MALDQGHSRSAEGAHRAGLRHHPEEPKRHAAMPHSANPEALLFGEPDGRLKCRTRSHVRECLFPGGGLRSGQTPKGETAPGSDSWMNCPGRARFRSCRTMHRSPQNVRAQDHGNDLGLWAGYLWPHMRWASGATLGHPCSPRFARHQRLFKIHISWRDDQHDQNPAVMNVSPVSMVNTKTETQPNQPGRKSRMAQSRSTIF